MNLPTCVRLLAILFLATLSSCATSGDNLADSSKPITLDNYVLTGRYAEGEVTFTLQASAHTPAAKTGGEIVLLSGPVSATTVPETLTQRLDVRGDNIILKANGWSELAIDLPFRAKVKEADGWKTVDFTPAAANIRQLVLEGWPADAKVELPDASQAVRKDGRITANLPGAGHVVLSWKEAPPETAGKLFFSADGVVQDTVAPGVLRQTDQLTLHILQGKLEHIDLDLTGDGEVTHVDGPTNTILSWKVSPGATTGMRRLSVDLNAPQTGTYALTVQMEMPLPALPATATPPRLAPVGASSYGGLLRVQNEGTVRLEVGNTTGLSQMQIAAEQIPQGRPANAPPVTQAFAYRFADTGYSYTVSADNVLPEFTVDGIIAYHLGDTDTYLEAQINLDIREAPLRELNLLVPADWAVASLQGPGIADHFLTPAGDGRAQLRLLFANPIIGRQAVQLRLERNAGSTAVIPAATEWILPPISVKDAKSARGFVGVTSDASLRLTPTAIDGLTDATASFPVKLDNLQAAWRFLEDPWRATLRVEHLAASIQADALHIFSIGQELALGSTVLNLNIAGAPVTVLRLQNTGGYKNVEFIGRYKRDVTQTGDIYEVHLDHPVSGAYTLLATYELPFKPAGDTLPFTGMRPLDVQTEQGHVLLASSYPFNLVESKVSQAADGMTRLEAAEIPAEYRLLCDAPILACYQYAARPFDAMLQLEPLATGSTVDQVVDIGEIETHISSTGEVITTARYLLKSKGHDFLQLSLPKGANLWSVTVAGHAVVPVGDKNAAGAAGDQALLVPLPRQGDPNVPLLIELKYTAATKEAGNVKVAAPAIHAPVLVTDWSLSADKDHRLRALDNAPVMETPRLSGLNWLVQIIAGKSSGPRPPIVPLYLRWRESPEPGLSHQEAFYLGLALALAGLIFLRGVRNRNLFWKIPGAIIGVGLALAGVVLLGQLGNRAAHDIDQTDNRQQVRLSIPVVEAGHALAFTFANEPAPKTAPAQTTNPMAWLLLPGIILALVCCIGSRGMIWRTVAWLLILTGTLGLPLGPQWFCLVLALTLAWVNGRALLSLRGKKRAAIPPVATAPVAVATTAVLLCLLWIGSAQNGIAAVASVPAVAGDTVTYTVKTGETIALIARRYNITGPQLRALNHLAASDRISVGQVLLVPASAVPGGLNPAVAEVGAPSSSLVLSINQTGSIQDGFARMQAELTWRAEKGSQLSLLRAPAVLTLFKGDPVHLSLAQSTESAKSDYVLTANSAGIYKVSFSYEVHATDGQAGAASVVLPTPGGLVNEVALDLARADLDASSDNAVSLRTTPGTGGLAHMTASFAAEVSPMLRWSPRARDLSAEKPLYYADWRQLYVPAAGIVDGRHEVHLRLAQGEIKELVFSVPQNLTISAVESQGLASWRFDPDQHKLHAYFEPALKNAFNVVIHSQASAAPLPYTTSLLPIRLDGATSDAGLLATATSSEVELGAVTAENLATVNLDDFPSAIARATAPQGETDTVRRAYSYGAVAASLKVEALAVVPDVRVDSQQRLSLGEDRVLLAVHLNVTVNRAGIFKLSFVLPTGFEYESISGDHLSNWTESGAGANRIITLNLKDKTTGAMAFDITLSSPGMSTQQNWTAPRLTLREADKQTGLLVLAPELGLRPQVRTRDNLTQVDPKDVHIDIEGALVFRILQGDWTLTFDIEKIAPHIQVEALQDITVREGSTEVQANLNYQIDNAGVRELRLQVPAGAIGVHISGPQVSDSLPVENQPTQWLVRLQRRSIGALALNVTYQLPPAGADNKLAIVGLQTLGTDQQRGFVDLRSRGRLETRVSNAPASLQPTDWESVPTTLRHDSDGGTPSLTFRAVDPAFTLPVDVVRHEAAAILPARVESVNLRSLVSPDGQLLTAVTVRLLPGDKRHLDIKLPASAKFWFAFVNDKGVTPSLDKGDFLLPLEPNPVPSDPATVEFLYEQTAPAAGAWSQAELAGPRFDLPLQNISWQLYLPETWKVTHWTGPWQKSGESPMRQASGGGRSLNDYLADENNRLNQQNAKAENFLAQGNQMLQKGQQMQARDLFSSAYQISQKDSAFNEDARVQWQNLREQQAMVSLANGQNSFSNSIQTANANNLNVNAPAQNNLVLSQTELLNFTDQQVRKILGANVAEDNTVLANLAHSLVKQQADTLPHPVAIHATLPERGQVYEFTQSLLVTPDADLSLKLTAGPESQPVAWIGLAALVVLGLIVAASFKIVQKPTPA